MHCNHITGDTVNVPGISWTRETAKKLAWKILNVLPVPRSVYSGYFVHVYLQCTSPVHHPLPPVIWTGDYGRTIGSIHGLSTKEGWPSGQVAEWGKGRITWSSQSGSRRIEGGPGDLGHWGVAKSSDELGMSSDWWGIDSEQCWLVGNQ